RNCLGRRNDFIGSIGHGWVWGTAGVFVAVGRRAENEIADLPDFLFEVRTFRVKSFFDFESLNGGFFGGVESKRNFGKLEPLTLDFNASFGQGGVLVGDLEVGTFKVERLSSVKSARELI